MTNIDRLKMEIESITLTDEQLSIYLQENDLTSTNEYTPTSNINKKNIYRTALSILESIANNPTYMRNVKNNDMTITEFSKNINNRIDSLDRKIRLMSSDDNDNGTGASFVYLFTE
ncbi:hypothetical protein [Clostridium coskatii]|uniref:Uncharacterized protein n=1 Tax=Clostridium coskatii TaxID=1705578 RepID=A0A168R754_9CLOT|nr:hypothetical protein [Clostridium coskatii]OAA90137.1 hypothetical protein WX73_02101 [Clostridium coskatii]OBR97428.1 hypothetical protein CLCOS_03670 [Clostridium coskatii]